jgi:extracellular elastinolytic metalloproteinase
MRNLLAAIVVFTSSVAPAVASAPAKVYRSDGANALTRAAQDSPSAVAIGFLRGRGLDRRTADSVREAGQHPGRGGLTHVRLEQEINGLRVHGAYAKAAVNGRSELVHLIDALVAVPRSGVKPARVSERQALQAALRALHPSAGEPAESGRQDHVVRYDQGNYFQEGPSVERVIARMGNGELATGFLVDTWSRKQNLLHRTLVGPDGNILSIELRTNTDSYNVFDDSPIDGGQAVVAGPAPGATDESPLGWLGSGKQLTWNIIGNNAQGYLDVNANNQPDRGGVAVTNGAFLAALDAASAPGTVNNRNVAVQNLFFHNNLIHDTLWTAGFTEAEGNFQKDNFGRGGKPRDPVSAEAQDGSGTDNANFATPPDGRAPRMQMFLWTPPGVNQVVVHAPAAIAGTYLAEGNTFGPNFDPTGVTADVALADDGVAPGSDACEPLAAGSLTGRIALIDRGTCTFIVKVKNAQGAGAVAVLVANNDTAAPDAAIALGGDPDPTVNIPSGGVSFNTGATLKSGLAEGVNATVKKTDPPAHMIDSSLDADIIWHEYGHGLSWRMIGGMSGPMAGALGEGNSDVLALIHGDDDVVAEYSASDARGIRRNPYDAYPRTYGSLNGPAAARQVHNDGEVYGAIGWRLIEHYTAALLSRADLLRDLVEGMKFTPARPAYEDMRDGILQAVSNRGGDVCLVWSAFAEYGVGVGANGVENADGSLTVSESFVVPATCP